MSGKILIVDDMKKNREQFVEILKDTYEIMEASNGAEAWKIILTERKNLALIILDLNMPEIDGYTIMENMKKNNLMDIVPILAIGEEREKDAEKRCLNLGAADYVIKTCDSTVIKKRVDNIVRIYNHKSRLEEKMENQMLTLRKQYKILQLQADKLQKKNDEIANVVGNVAEYRSLESGSHLRRVRQYTRILGEYVKDNYPEYGLTKEKLDMIVSASALHDIGKVAIPDSILLNPGRLSELEYNYLRSHTYRGGELLEDFRNVWSEEYLKIAQEICRYHHERYDGKGYPEGLVGDAIPISAQLVSIVDVYDAMTNERFYKGALAVERVFYMITNGECGIFSPKLLEAFRKVKPKFEEMAVAYRKKLQERM